MVRNVFPAAGNGFSCLLQVCLLTPEPEKKKVILSCIMVFVGRLHSNYKQTLFFNVFKYKTHTIYHCRPISKSIGYSIFLVALWHRRRASFMLSQAWKIVFICCIQGNSDIWYLKATSPRPFVCLFVFLQYIFQFFGAAEITFSWNTFWYASV